MLLSYIAGPYRPLCPDTESNRAVTIRANLKSHEHSLLTPMDHEKAHQVGTLGPGEEVQFRYEAVMGCDRQIVVQWRRPSETDPRQWRGHVPA